MNDLDRKLRDLILKSEGKTLEDEAISLGWAKESWELVDVKLDLPRILMALNNTLTFEENDLSLELVRGGLKMEWGVFNEANDLIDDVELTWDLTKDAYGQSTETKTLLINLLSE